MAELELHDRYLLVEDVNERTLSYRLAMYLQRGFPDWHVDAEYNRVWNEPDRPKRLELPTTPVGWDDTKARTVFPDIIVHHRGTTDNLLVLELKKAGLDTAFDEKKLKAYREQLGYSFAILVVARSDRENPGFEAPEHVEDVAV